jgi:hypothetical protein
MTDVTQAQQTNNWPVANVPNPMSRSLRFRASATAYLTRTPATATNRKTWTWSAWVKRGTLSTSQVLLSAGGSSSPYQAIYLQADNTLAIEYFNNPTNYYVITTQVFRDPSAWYHIVMVWDTTQATDSNRVKIYVNGVQVTAFAAAVYPTQNLDGYINNNQATTTGCWSNSVASFFDGYMAEVNFVDGQALTPTSFGQYDQFGNWTSKKYTGTYGTNGFYLPFSNNSSTGTLGLDFSGNNNTWTTNNFSLAASTVRQTFTTTGTTSWTAPAGVTSVDYLVVAGGGGGSNSGGGAGGMRTGTLTVVPSTSYTVTVGAGGVGGNASPASNGSDSVFASITSTGGGGGVSAGNNGQSGGSGGGGGASSTATTTGGSGTSGQGNAGGTNGGFTVGPYPSGGGGGAGAVGGNGVSTTQAGNGGAGLASSISGSSVTYAGGGGGAVFVSGNTPGTGGAGGGGAGSSTGTGTAGTPNTGGGGGGANQTGGQTGGAGGSGIVILSYSIPGTGSTYDSMTDVPTQWTPYNVTGDVGAIVRGNYAVLNPLDYVNSNTGSLTSTNGNLLITRSTTAYGGFPATMALPSSGKFVFEFTATQAFNGSTNEAYFGIGVQSNGTFTNPSATGYVGDYYTGVNVTGSSGSIQSKISGGSITTPYSGGAVATGDIFQFLVDMTNGTVDIKKNGSAYGSQVTGLPNTLGLYPYISLYGSVSMSINFGQYAFTYAPPSGYKSLCTTNLPTPTIQQGNLVMNATTYTGNGTGLGSTQTISNGNFQPDFIWIKSRSTTDYHQVFDSVRGIVGTGSPSLITNLTDAEATYTGYGVSAVTSTGFTLIGNGSFTNGNGISYVGWQWKAGQGTNTTNTAGSITSTVSVNATAGLSVVTYTGNGSAGATVGHGLGAAANMVIVKERNGAENWQVYHSSLGATKRLFLNLTNAEQATTAAWNDTAPTSSVFSLGTSNAGNGNTNTYVAYCWSEIAGFSKFGSYTGNGSTDGAFIYTGFRPKFIMLKNSTSAASWSMLDTSRNTYNISNARLFAESSQVEDTSQDTMDILSNGFKLRATGLGVNGSGSTIIYMAFAEYPFKSALAR